MDSILINHYAHEKLRYHGKYLFLILILNHKAKFHIKIRYWQIY